MKFLWQGVDPQETIVNLRLLFERHMSMSDLYDPGFSGMILSLLKHSSQKLSHAEWHLQEFQLVRFHPWFWVAWPSFKMNLLFKPILWRLITSETKVFLVGCEWVSEEIWEKIWGLLLPGIQQIWQLILNLPETHILQVESEKKN